MNFVTYFSDPTPANFTEYSILSAAEAEKGGDQFFHGMYALFIAPSVFKNSVRKSKSFKFKSSKGGDYVPKLL